MLTHGGNRYSEIDPTNSHASAHPIDQDGHAAFKLKQGEDETESTVSVLEMTTRHLKRLRDSASDYLGTPVNAAVITVPTDFTKPQREALIEAAKAIDLEVLQLIHEPVAAVLAYAAREEHTHVDKNIVIADFGGTRCDVAVITVRGGMYTILATAHDYELGGAKLDDVLVEYFAKEFQKQHKVDPRENPRSLAKLKQEVEWTKKTLSLSTSATISIDSLAEGYDFHSNINRTRYELLAKKVFDQMVNLVEGVVTKAELDLLDIDEVSPQITSIFHCSQVLTTTTFRSSSPAVPPIPLKSPTASPPSSPNPPPSTPLPPPSRPSTPPSSPPAAPLSKPNSSKTSTRKTLNNPLTLPSRSPHTSPKQLALQSLATPTLKPSTPSLRATLRFQHARRPSSTSVRATMRSSLGYARGSGKSSLLSQRRNRTLPAAMMKTRRMLWTAKTRRTKLSIES